MKLKRVLYLIEILHELILSKAGQKLLPVTGKFEFMVNYFYIEVSFEYFIARKQDFQRFNFQSENSIEHFLFL